MKAIQPLPPARRAAGPGDEQATIAARPAPAARRGAGAIAGVFSLAFLVPAAHAQAAPAARPAGVLLPSSVAAAARSGPDQLRVAFRITAARPAPYTVRPGDTLSSVSARLFGNPDRWPWLYDANRGVIGGNPDLIVPGEKLRPVLGARPEYGDAVAAVARAQQASAAYKAATAPVTVSSYQPGYGSTGGGSYSGFEACVIARESGGSSQVMNSSGHYGLMQFSESTWEAYGGPASEFGHASVAEQQAVFNNAMARGGESNWSSYDGC